MSEKESRKYKEKQIKFKEVIENKDNKINDLERQVIELEKKLDISRIEQEQ